MNRSAQSGMTLMEMMVVMFMSLVIFLIIFSSADEMTQVSMLVESRNNLAEYSQRAVNTMQMDIIQAKHLFQDDAVGRSYMDNITAQLIDHPIAPGNVLPTIDPAGVIGDAGSAARDGNCLLVVRQLPPLRVPAAGAQFFSADRYQFVFYYLHQNRDNDQKRFPAYPAVDYFLDVWYWRSVQYADQFQLSQLTGTLTNAQKTTLFNTLAAAGINRAWDPTPGSALNTVFYTLNASLTFAAPIASPTIALGTDRRNHDSLIRELAGARIAGQSLYSIAFAGAGVKTDTQVRPEEANTPWDRWMQPDALPNDVGFETQIVGIQGRRTVLTRLILLSWYRRKFHAQEGIVLTSFTRA